MMDSKTRLPKNWILKHARTPRETLWSALLAARSIQDPGAFFNDVSVSDLYDPFAFEHMQKAVDRIHKALAERERIIVYGDYDVDGTSGAALLLHTLKKLGAQVSYRIPHRRNEGYGLHAHHIDELASQNVKVLITVDLGISCFKEVTQAQAQGIDVLITDHHTLPLELPPAHAILHPKVDANYPFKELSGSGVAFKLASALLQSVGEEEALLALTDLASLGTVADCVPLLGENRTLVKLGLLQLRKTEWQGLRSILARSGVLARQQAWGSDVIGFQIGPRLNAAGRMDTPYWALQTLLAETPEEADQKSLKLEALNRERQEFMQSIQEEVELKMLENAQHSESPIVVVSGAGWSSGLVGLIAGRLQEKYSKPVFLMEDQGETLTGSVRSVPGFNAVEALQHAASSLEKFGGHEMAGGFHLLKSKQALFESLLHEFAAQKALENGGSLSTPNLQIDSELHPEDLSIELLSKLSMFAPFGVGNPQPLLLASGVKLNSLKSVGATGKHFKAQWNWQGQKIETIAFNVADKTTEWERATQLVLTPELNEWKGKIELSFHLKAWA